MLASSVHLKLHMKSENTHTDTHPSLHIYISMYKGQNSTSVAMYYFGITSSCVVRSSRRLQIEGWIVHNHCAGKKLHQSHQAGDSNRIKSCFDTTTAIEQLPV